MRAAATAPVLALIVAGVAGCGGEKTKVDEKSGDFRVEVTHASFAARQHVAGTTDLRLAVKNTGSEPLPQLVVTIWTGEGGVDAAKPQGAFSSPTHPIWVPEHGFPKLLGEHASAGADAAATDSYVFGALAAGASRTAVWRVTPVRAGTYTVHYAVAAGAQGRAKAVTAGGGPAGGRFHVQIDGVPRGGCVVTARGLRSGEGC
jgi:hypothetical protein